METNSENIQGFSAVESRSESPTNGIAEETQNSTSEEKKDVVSSNRCFVWIVLKGFIFITCLLFLFYQSVLFYHHYLTYPLTTRYEIKKIRELTKPAITICNRNLFRLYWFCYAYPKFCQTPDNLDKFCVMHYYYCTEHNSELKIPKLGYYAEKPSEEFRMFLLDAYKNHSMRNKFLFRNALLGTSWNYTPTLVQEPFLEQSKNVEQGLFVPCISANLHLLSSGLPDTMPFYVEDESQVIARFILRLKKSEEFFPWKDEKLFFIAIHSPYVPVDPIDAISLEAGNEYNFRINLASGYNIILSCLFRAEEEHLQPYPYKTDCIDYEALWERRNKTGPRSQEMCKELCRLEFSRKCFGCDQLRVLNVNPKNLCPEDIDKEDICFDETLKEEMALCKRNCKRSCKKLKYRYSFSKPAENELTEEFYSFTISGQPYITILSQEPLYGTWDLFSYIGGLMGCWLGISVWALAGIFEKTFHKVVFSIHQLKLKRN